MRSFSELWVFLALCQLVRWAAAERSFQGTYTIVNAATGRRLVTDTQGFYTTSTDFIPQTHFWHIIPAENATHTLEHGLSKVRVYAQIGQEHRNGFFVIASDTPVYRDQRWQIQWSDGGYTLTNLKSGRSMADGPDGLIASVELQRGSYWWLISQERDELGLELAKQLLECPAAAAPSCPSWQPERDAIPASAVLATLAVLVMVVALRVPRRDGFHYHIHKSEAEGVVQQVVQVQCPGVRQEDIEVKLIPNGCDVVLHRRARPGFKEVSWRQRFHFDLSEGFFEFVEEQMQLEQGILVLVLREVRHDRTIRFAQCQHFCLDAFDDELNWDFPMGKEDVKNETTDSTRSTSS